MLADKAYQSKESESFIQYYEKESEPISRKFTRHNECDDQVFPLRFSLKNSSAKIVDESFLDNANITASSATIYKIRNQS
jgi:hypothetical protein